MMHHWSTPSSRSAVLILTIMGFSACGKEAPGSGDTWPATARSASESLENLGYDCLEEGRELYPVLFVCTQGNPSEAGTIYLYADDRNDLVGIRVFAAEREATRFLDALRLAYRGPIPANLFPPSDEEWLLELRDDLVVEAGGPDANRHLRITPKHRIITP